MGYWCNDMFVNVLNRGVWLSGVSVVTHWVMAFGAFGAWSCYIIACARYCMQVLGYILSSNYVHAQIQTWIKTTLSLQTRRRNCTKFLMWHQLCWMYSYTNCLFKDVYGRLCSPVEDKCSLHKYIDNTGIGRRTVYMLKRAHKQFTPIENESFHFSQDISPWITMNKTIFAHRLLVSLALFTFCKQHHNLLHSKLWAQQLWRDRMKRYLSDSLVIDFIHGVIQSRSCKNGIYQQHDDVIKWKHFPRYWPFVRWIPRTPVTRNFDVFFDLSLNKRLSKQSGDLRRHQTHYDVIVMKIYGTKIDRMSCVFVSWMSPQSVIVDRILTSQEQRRHWMAYPSLTESV